jgi:glycopeptide antibiotics resistance protein
MNRIDLFLSKIIDELDADNQTKSEVFDELNDHLQMSKRSYIEKGLSEDEAEKKAITDFGESKLIGANLQKSMYPAKHIARIAVWCVFFSYMVLTLLKTLVGGGLVFYQNGEWTTQRIDRYQTLFMPMHMSATFNLVPFKTTYHYLIHHQMYNTDIWFNNTFGNVFLFIPIGFLLSVLFLRFQRKSIVIGVSAALGALIEIIQLVTKSGVADIDTIILRTIGSVFGVFIYSCVIWSISKVKNRTKLVKTTQ